MKKILSICFLWAFSFALWGQSNGGYGGDFNPTNPGNPQEPTVTMKYDFRVTAGKGGNVSHYPSEAKFTKDTQIQLNANPNAGYKFKCWMEDNKVISTSSWFYYTMPAKDVKIQAVFAFEPEVPANPDVIPLTYKLTVEGSPSNAGHVYRDREKVNVGEYTYVGASAYNGYQFKGWQLDGKIVSTDSHYYFEMPSRNMHFTALFEFNPGVPDNPNSNPNNEPTYLLKYTIDGQVCYTEHLPAGATITAIAEPIKKGYTFSGWSTVPVTMPASDLVISGTFTVNQYHITYKVEDKVIHEEDIAYGTTPTPPAGEARVGYILVWKNLPTTMPDSDVVVEGSYSINSYKLTYIVDGNVYKTYDVVYQSEVTPLEDPTKEGYTFSGWSEIPEIMPAEDVTVTGSFSVNSYKITYMLDGEFYKEVVCDYGTTITAETVTKVGYSFSGWDGLPQTMPAEDITVTGSFTINTYKLIYKVDGVVYKTYDVVYATAITPEADPTKEGHTFGGWSGFPETMTMPAEDVTVIGSFSVNSYTLTYMVDGEVYATSTYTYGSYINYMDAPYKEGHSFNGWEGLPEYMPANDVTVNATYSVNSYMVYYYVDGMIYHSEYVAYGSTMTPPEVSSREGYVFSWEGLPETMPAWDVYVYGYYNMQYYTVTYMVDGEVYMTSSYTYGSYIYYMDAPYKEGYSFNGWEGLPEYMPANDITVNATYSVNSYMVYYYVDGMIYHSEYVAYGSTITAPEASERDGYVFSGWEGLPETMPAWDVYVYGYYNMQYYTVTYMVDGEVYMTSSYTYGSYINYMDAPYKEGYVFCGWEGLPTYMPNNDITVEANYSVYSPNSYIVTYYVDGMVYHTEYVVSGTLITLPEPPVKEGYVFGGWEDYPIVMPNYDVYIYGNFYLKDAGVEYPYFFTVGEADGTVANVVDGRFEFTSQVYDAGSRITKLRFKFLESYNENGRDCLDSGLYPQVAIAEFYLYDANGNPVELTVDNFSTNAQEICEGPMVNICDKDKGTFWHSAWTFDIGAYHYLEVTIPDGLNLTAFSFGWTSRYTSQVVPKTVEVSGLTDSVSNVPNVYTLTYALNGEVYRTFSYAEGTAITPLEMPMIEGYSFSGWEGLPEYMPAYDVTYEGSYTPNTYRIYYYLDDMLVHTVDVLYGDSMPWPPTLDGYPFIEWMGETYDSMPAHDVVYIANVNNGIEQSATDASQMVVYDLSGRKISVSNLRELTKGVYVVNGKKVLIK